MLSRKFIIAIKLNDSPAYKIAREAGLNPVILSKLIHGALDVRPNDKRILKVAKVLGLKPEECFKKA